VVEKQKRKCATYLACRTLKCNKIRSSKRRAQEKWQGNWPYTKEVKEHKHNLFELIIGGVEKTSSTAHSSGRHGGEEGGITENAAVKRGGRRREENLDVGGAGELRDPGVELGGDDDSPGELGIDLHDDAPGGGVAPVAAILEAEYDELLVLHLGPDERLDGTCLGLQSAVPAAGSGSDEAGSVDDGEVGTVLVLHSDDDFFGGELA